MTKDPLQDMRGDVTAQHLYHAIGRACEGMPLDVVVTACVNMIASCVRQNVGLRAEAEAAMSDISGRMMQVMMEHYDPVTGKRRSVYPFNQVISPSRVESDFRVLGLGGKGNGRT